MRLRPTVVLALTVACAGVAGPALAAVAGRGSSPDGSSYTGTSPQTLSQTTTTSTLTSTTSTSTTQTSTTTTSIVPQLVVCIAAEQRQLAAALKVQAATIHERQFISTNGMPQCNYLVARAHSGGPRGKVVVTVNVDNGPQPHWRLMRKVVEASQLFGPAPKGWRAPTAVPGLGPYASWFWNLNQLMALNVGHEYLLTVGVIWHHATKAELRSLAFKAIMVYRRIGRLAA
jgi:hypothetical protein